MDMKNIAVCDLLSEVYKLLIDKFGPQGWWPVKSLAGEWGVDDKGYHPGRFDIPSNDSERFEIIVGAILTQNTTWKNVEEVLDKLIKENLVNPKAIAEISSEELAVKIRSCGYYNQKAKKLKAISHFFLSESEARGVKNSSQLLICPRREDLLRVWGVGKETADSILLYAFDYPIFVIDAYTKRFVLSLNEIWQSRYGRTLIDKDELNGTKWYDILQGLFHSCLPRESSLYNEFHALIVRARGNPAVVLNDS